MTLIEDYDLVQTFGADRSDEAFDERHPWGIGRARIPADIDPKALAMPFHHRRRFGNYQGVEDPRPGANKDGVFGTHNPCPNGNELIWCVPF